MFLCALLPLFFLKADSFSFKETILFTINVLYQRIFEVVFFLY